MAKCKVSASEMAARIMGAGMPLPSAQEKSAFGESGRESSDVKRLNLNISIDQWRKLKRYATERDMTVSDIVRGFIDSL